MQLLLLSVMLSSAPSNHAAALQEPADDAVQILRERVRLSGRSQPAGTVERLGPGTGNQLFFHVGPNNAPCVRSYADVSGDGLDEVVVGIDESGVDNIFSLDGASSGAATPLWQLETADGVSGGSPWGDQSLEPISDSDGNGYPNVLLGTAWGGRTAYNLDGLTGAIQWRFDTYLEVDSGWVYSLAELSDVTGDGIPEVAFGCGSDNDSVYLVNGATTPGQASVLWKYHAPDAVFSVRNIGDVNGDLADDVLAAAGDLADRIVCLSGNSANPAGTVLWQYAPGQNIFACGVCPDITGDGIDEALAVLWISGGSAIRCLNGATGGLVWSSTTVVENGMMVDVLADVTGDGVDEVIAASWENAVQVLDGMTGAQVWKTTVGTLNGGDVWTAQAMDDVNGDGNADVIAGSFDTNVYALDGDSGAVLWSFNTGNRVFSVYPVGDLNGDGRPEVAAATQDTTNSVVLHVIEGDSGLPDPPATYCAGKTNSLGCVPFITTSGFPSETTGTFLITGNDMMPSQSGLNRYVA